MLFKPFPHRMAHGKLILYTGSVHHTTKPKMDNNQSTTPVPCDPLKRATDIILSLGGFVLFSPLFLVIAILIKLEGLIDGKARGPVFRHEIRITQGEPFKFYKFRFIKQQILDEEKIIRRRDRAKTLEKDHFCTMTGKFCKKIYLDELPQLYNILIGDMSFVGPRPFPQDDYEEDLKNGDYRKKRIKAGLSGIVQINKGQNPGLTDRQMDNIYIETVRTMTPLKRWMYDMGILLRTTKIIWQAKGI